MTDPFDEFEFKPLTEGLGFHRQKNEATKTTTTQLEMIDELQPPLPRRKAAPSSPIAESTAVQSVYKALEKDPVLDFDHQRRVVIPKKPEALQESVSVVEEPKVIMAPWSFGAFLLDVVVILAMALTFLICFVLVTHVDLVKNLAWPLEGPELFIGIAGLYTLIGWMYYVACRGFVGFTLGEWAYDLQLGTDADRAKSSYMGKVILREFLTLVTGVIPLPLASVFMRRDLPGQIVGLFLVRR